MSKLEFFGLWEKKSTRFNISGISYDLKFRLLLLLNLMILLSCNRSDIKAEPSFIPFMNEKISWADSVLHSMTLEEKLGQLLIYKGNALNKTQKIRLYNAVILGQVGGLIVEQLPLEEYISLVDSCQLLSHMPLFVGSEQKDFLNNQFSDLSPMPSREVLSSIGKDSLQVALDRLYLKQARALGINWSYPAQQLSANFIRQLNHNGIVNFASGVEELKGYMSDTSQVAIERLQQLRAMIKSGLSGFYVDDKVYLESVQLPKFKSILKKELEFDGLLMTNWNNKAIPLMLQSGVDLFVIKNTPEQAIFHLKSLLKAGLITESSLDEKIKRILMAKYWTLRYRKLPLMDSSQPISLQASIAPIAIEQNTTSVVEQNDVVEHFKSPEWEWLKQELYEQSITLASNPGKLLPLKDIETKRFLIWEYSRNPLKDFRTGFGRYADYAVNRRPGDHDGLKAFSHSKGVSDIVVIDNYIIRPEEDSLFIQSLEAGSKHDRLIIVNFGAPQNLLLFDSSQVVVQVYERNEHTETLTASLLFGGFQPIGQLPERFRELTNLPGGETFNPIRMKYTLPQEVGVDPARLVGIDAIMNSAIDDGVMPGGQVLVARRGKIIYNKSFGHHTYRKSRAVESDDLYDVASVTKVAATTLGLMRLYDEQKISLDSKLKDVVELPNNSTLEDLTLRKLMIHQSGLQVYMPVAPYLSFRDKPNALCDSFFCKNSSDTFGIKVADDFYFQQRYLDTVWQEVNQLRLYRRRRTRYSDVNFYLLQKVVEHQFGTSLDRIAYNHFYHPLGIRHTLFNPLKKFQKRDIIPTEKDNRWRQQLVHGFVHDETAAIMGGVAGHAGLFSTAEDLAVLFQMLLNKGYYGGRQYFNPQTVDIFTKKQYGTHRGLGFDKPKRRSSSAISDEASYKTFGHTGFTGTCVWADPEEDLIFIFLSNRVHPYARNPLLIRKEVRRRVHQVIYDALDSFQPHSLDKMARDLKIGASGTAFYDVSPESGD